MRIHVHGPSRIRAQARPRKLFGTMDPKDKQGPLCPLLLHLRRFGFSAGSLKSMDEMIVRSNRAKS